MNNLEEYHWTTLSGANRRGVSALLHILNPNVDLGYYADNYHRRARMLCGVEAGLGPRITDLAGRRFCKYCLAAVGIYVSSEKEDAFEASTDY